MTPSGERGRRDPAGWGGADLWASQQTEEVAVQGGWAGVEEQQAVAPLQRGGGAQARGAVAPPVLVHVQDGGQQGGLELLQLLLQHQQQEAARRACERGARRGKRIR